MDKKIKKVKKSIDKQMNKLVKEDIKRVQIVTGKQS